jgi:hypothetical protein
MCAKRSGKMPQDEIFHVPQAQAYCRGDFHGEFVCYALFFAVLSRTPAMETVWDGNITTYPGIYLSAAVAKAIVPGFDCSVTSLRLLNTLFAVCFAWLVLVAVKQQRQRSNEVRTSNFDLLLFGPRCRERSTVSVSLVSNRLCLHHCFDGVLLCSRQHCFPTTSCGTRMLGPQRGCWQVLWR